MYINRLKTELFVSAAAFVFAYLLSLSGYYMLSGAVLIAAAIYLMVLHIKKSGKLSDPAAYFSLSWIGGVGVSALKLSYLQSDWSITSWLSFFLSYVCFITAYELLKELKYRKKNVRPQGLNKPENAADPAAACVFGSGLLSAINIVMLLSIAAFILEALLLKYIPLFTVDTPHAYSYFHVSGVHYFTVSCVLVPSLSVIYAHYFKDCIKNDIRVRCSLIICLSLSLIIPLLLVSRFQLIFSVMLAAATYLNVNGGNPGFSLNKKSISCIAVLGMALIAGYVFITYERAHSIEYLKGIFEIKYEKLPIFVTQPYIYIANNFDNFNMLTMELKEHTNGLKMLFPVFALTGMKFTHPELVSFPLYVTKEELTTLTLIYDAYYDFGIPGVMAFTLLLGLVTSWLEEKLAKGGFMPVTVFVYSQIMFYLLFSFFTTWFSNPATWFYFTASLAIGVYIKITGRLFNKRL